MVKHECIKVANDAVSAHDQPNCLHTPHLILRSEAITFSHQPALRILLYTGFELSSPGVCHFGFEGWRTIHTGLVWPNNSLGRTRNWRGLVTMN